MKLYAIFVPPDMKKLICNYYKWFLKKRYLMSSELIRKSGDITKMVGDFPKSERQKIFEGKEFYTSFKRWGQGGAKLTEKRMIGLKVAGEQGFEPRIGRVRVC
jgi:hypothetical protein